MSGVLAGFLVIGVVIGTGYLVARRGVLGPHAQEVLSRASFVVATPALLFETLAGADLSAVFSSTLVVTSAAFALCAVVFAVVGAARRWGIGRTTIGALAASMVNSANLGIPIAVYVLGDATAVAPVLLFQLVVLSPVALAVLDVTATGERSSSRARVTAPLRNPVLVASALGLLVAGTGLEVPRALLDPIELLGGLAVPAVLLAYGMSLRGSPLPGRGAERATVVLAVVLKLVVAPGAAWLFGLLLGLDRAQLLVVVVLATLPTAQNLFGTAVTYRTGVDLARESITLSTVLSVPAMLVVAGLLG
ncbi:AEC family transporter [Geodermatophilus sp. SYSU D00697]